MYDVSDAYADYQDRQEALLQKPPARVTVNHRELMDKARRHLKHGAVEHLYGGQWKVTSGNSGLLYAVRELTVHGDPGATCSCPWGGFRRWADVRSACSHVRAVYIWVAQNGHPLETDIQVGRVLSAWGSAADAERQHRITYGIGDGCWLTSRIKDW